MADLKSICVEPSPTSPDESGLKAELAEIYLREVRNEINDMEVLSEYNPA